MDTRGPATDGHSSKLVNYRHLGFAIWLILLFAALQIGRAAVSQNTYYIDLHQYAHMAVRPPFQNRILMAYVLAAVEHNRWFLALHHRLFSRTVDDPLDLASMLVNCACLVLLLPITVALRRAFVPPPANVAVTGLHRGPTIASPLGLPRTIRPRRHHGGDLVRDSHLRRVESARSRDIRAATRAGGAGRY